jgi:methionine-rich copper-binding protein CopC
MLGRWRAGSRRPGTSALFLAVAVAAVLAVARGSVLAHALLHASQPAAGSTLGSSPPAVTLTFGE